MNVDNFLALFIPKYVRELTSTSLEKNKDTQQKVQGVHPSQNLTDSIVAGNDSNTSSGLVHNEPGEPADESIQTYLDERGRFRVSRLRAMVAEQLLDKHDDGKVSFYCDNTSKVDPVGATEEGKKNYIQESEPLSNSTDTTKPAILVESSL